MKIQNSKTKTPTGVMFNDKDYMNKLLSCLKEMAKNYTIMLTEASNDILYEIYFKFYEELLDAQREVYLVMFQNGWYSLESQDDSKISTKYTTLLKEYNDLFSE